MNTEYILLIISFAVVLIYCFLNRFLKEELLSLWDRILTYFNLNDGNYSLPAYEFTFFHNYPGQLCNGDVPGGRTVDVDSNEV